MGTYMQNIYKCVHFTPNGNLNKTCSNKTRCCVFYEVTCPLYKETLEEYKKEIVEGFKNSLEQAIFKNKGE